MANPTTGAKVPTVAQTVSEGNWSDDTWVSPQNIYGTGYASVTATSFDAGDQTYILKACGFDFSAIPDNAVIRGVTCVVNAKYATALASIDCLQLLDTSRARTGTNLCATPQALTTSDANYTFGSGTNLWGCALTVAWVKDADFGVGIGCLAGGSGNNNVDVYIDSVTLDITYEHIITAGVVDTAIVGKDLTALKVARLLTAGVASFAIAGQNLTTLKATRLLSTGVTDFAISGKDLTALKADRKLVTAVTEFIITGQDVLLTKGGGLNHYVITAEVAEFNVVGQDLTSLKVTRRLPTQVTEFSIVGQDLTKLVVDRKLPTAVTEFIIAGQDLTKLTASRKISTGVAEFEIVGQDLTALKADRRLVTAVTNFAIAGKNILLVYSGEEVVAAYRWNGTEWVAIDLGFEFVRWTGSEWV